VDGNNYGALITSTFGAEYTNISPVPEPSMALLALACTRRGYETAQGGPPASWRSAVLAAVFS
jgi:hypothetical protein